MLGANVKVSGSRILRFKPAATFTGLLDEVPGAAAAYSVRLLRQKYAGGLVRIRAVDSNGTDQGEADVLPYNTGDAKELDLNSKLENLDSNAVDRGLTNSDVLADLVLTDSGNYDGFTPGWKDQSPNARHATNSTASEQPQLVDTGKLITENGKPALQSDGTDDILQATFSSVISQPFSFFLTYKFISGYRVFASPSSNRVIYYHASQSAQNTMFAGITLRNSNIDHLNQEIHSLFFDTSNSELYSDGILEASGNIGSNSFGGNTLDIFEESGIGSFSEISLQELIMYPDDQRSNQSTIEQNKQDFFQTTNYS